MLNFKSFLQIEKETFVVGSRRFVNQIGKVRILFPNLQPRQ
jgi:hypothetical protein